jgi:hypothetical protein
MDQRSIALYLDLKGLSARPIHEDLVVILDAYVVAYSTVTCYLRETHFSPSADRIASGPIPEISNDADEAILLALGKTLFTSVRQLARLTHLSAATVYR